MYIIIYVINCGYIFSLPIKVLNLNSIGLIWYPVIGDRYTQTRPFLGHVKLRILEFKMYLIG